MPSQVSSSITPPASATPPATSPTVPPPHQRGTMNVWGVAALGIGSMIGAGIFALLGQATLVAGKGVLLSFTLAGIAALFSGYSYAKLAMRYPTAGGILDYYNHGMPSQVIAGALSLMYLITLAVSTSMVAKTFGEYSAILLAHFNLPLSHTLQVNLCASGVIALLTLLNLVGAEAVGRAEKLIVGTKLLILFVLMMVGLYTLNVQRIQMAPMHPVMPVLGSVGLTFFAFAGFGMMTNAAADTADPAKTIPRAIYMAIGLVLVIYLGLAVVVLGNLLPAEIAIYRDTAIAHAARPVLGSAGFVIVSFAALLATSSAINAMIFSSLRISEAMAKDGQLPPSFRPSPHGKGSKGFLWAVVGVIAMTNLLDLSAVANIASTTFLLSYCAVIICHWRLRKETSSSPALILTGLTCILFVLGAFTTSLWQNSRDTLAFVALFIVLAMGTEIMLQRRCGTEGCKRDNTPER